MPIRHFAILPAAGKSVRMGARHKLLLPWKNETIMDTVLKAWTQSLATRVVVVVRREDRPLANLCRRWDVDVVLPESDPADMKRSVQLALEYLKATVRPQPTDRWLLAPSDIPNLGTELINLVIELSNRTEHVVVPMHGDQRGHPVSIPWSLVPEVFNLPEDQGINRIVDGAQVSRLEIPATELPQDIDTFDEYIQQFKS